MARVGSILEVSPGNHSADFEWRLTGSEAEEIGRGAWLYSPPVSFAGWWWRLKLAMEDSSSDKLVLRLYRVRDQSPAPVVRYSVQARTEDEGPEEEIGRGTMEELDNYISRSHPWLRVSELRRRTEGPAPPSGPFLSISLRLRTGPETEDEMKSLAGRDEATSSLEAVAEKLTKTELKDPETREASGSLSRQQEATWKDSEDSETGAASGSASRQQETTRKDSEGTLNLRKQLKELLLHGDDHDVLLRVKDKEFKAHKSLLRARSPVFRAMFRHNMKENAEDSVTIEDVDPECFREFLAFIYTGEVENLTATNATGLYYVADKYNVPCLKRKCVDVLKSSLATSVVCDVISLATTHGEEELLEVAMSYFTEHQVEVMETVEWQLFTLSNPIRASEVCLAATRRYRASCNHKCGLHK